MKGYINKERKRAHVRNKMDAHSRQNGRTFYLKRAFIFFKRINMKKLPDAFAFYQYFFSVVQCRGEDVYLSSFFNL